MNTKKTFSKKTLCDVPMSANRFMVGDAQMDSKDGKFKLVPYSGQQFKHWYWGKLAFEISGLSMRKSVIPAFVDHDSSRIAGEIDSLSIDGANLVLSGEFLDNDESKMINDTKKLEWESSLAFDMSSAIIEEVGENTESTVNGEKFEGAGYIVRSAELYETSFTFWGAVPNTNTEFDKNGKFSATILGVEEMAESNVPAEQIKAEGKTEATNLFAKMNDLSKDATFVAECFSKGMEIEEFQSELLVKLNKDNEELKAKVETLSKQGNNSEGVSFTSAESESGEGNQELGFIEEAHKFAKENSVPLRVAFSKVSKLNKDLYNKYLDECPQAVQARRG